MSRPGLPVGPDALAALARHPQLWPTACAVAISVLPAGWWRGWPPALSPPPDYVDFRARTMFGDRPAPRLSGDELVAYLRWCADMRRLAR